MSTDEPRDDFATMLGRATEDPPTDLVDRMQSYAALADTPARRRRLPRAGTLALVAASLSLVVGAAMLAGTTGPTALLRLQPRTATTCHTSGPRCWTRR